MKVKLVKYDCFNTNIPIDTIMEVIPGMGADAADVFNIPAGMCYLCKTPSGGLRYFRATNVEIVEGNSIDWEKVRIDAAIAIESSMLINNRDQQSENIAKRAVSYADALIEELKKE